MIGTGTGVVDLAGVDEGKGSPQQATGTPDVAKATPVKDAPENPTRAKTEKALPSAPTSGSRSNSAKGTSSKPSVWGELREIKAARQAEKEAETPARGERQADRPRGASSTSHTQPQGCGKTKPRKTKER